MTFRRTSSGLIAPINILGINKPLLLHRLWLGSSPALFFALSGLSPPKFDEEACITALECGYVDYFQGRAIKTNISGDIAETFYYDRYNGRGKFLNIVTNLRQHQ